MACAVTREVIATEAEAGGVCDVDGLGWGMGTAGGRGAAGGPRAGMVRHGRHGAAGGRAALGHITPRAAGCSDGVGGTSNATL